MVQPEEPSLDLAETNEPFSYHCDCDSSARAKTEKQSMNDFVDGSRKLLPTFGSSATKLQLATSNKNWFSVGSHTALGLSL